MRYKSICPVCGGNDFETTTWNGMSYCYHCRYYTTEGTIQRSIKKRGPIHEIRKYYKYMTMYAHSCLEQPHRKYLYSRGITDAQIEKEKIGFMPHKITGAKIAQHAGVEIENTNILEGRIIFPYWIDDTVYEIRGRTITDDEIRYKSPFGSTYYRGADIYYHQYHQEQDHILTEGEIKTLVAERFGFTCIGMPGITRRAPTYKNKGNIYLILDHESNKRTQAIIHEVCLKFFRCYRNCFVVTLPLRKGKKSELDTYLLMNGRTSLDILLESAMDYDTWREYVN